MRAVLLGFALLTFTSGHGLGAEDPAPVGPDRLAELLRDRDPAVRRKAVNGLANGRPVAENYRPVLRRALKDDDEAVRQFAAMALAASGSAEQPVLDELIRTLAAKHPPTYTAGPALRAEWALAELGARAVPALSAAAAADDFPGQWLAVAALARIGPEARPALPVLEKLLRDRRRDDFHRIVHAKWQIDRDAGYALKELIPLLDTKRGRRCDGAVRILPLMGADAKDAIPALVRALKKYNDHELAWALGELASHDRERAIPALVEALSVPDTAGPAASALRRHGLPADKIVPRLVGGLERYRDHDTAPATLAQALENFGPRALAAVPGLVAVLKHPNTIVRVWAARALGAIGPDARAAIPALTEALGDVYAAREAAPALERIRGGK